MQRLRDRLHSFEFSEVCRPRTEADQPRESCNSKGLKVQKKQQEFSGIISDVVADSSDTLDFQESSFAEEIVEFS